jgi:glutamine synthetase
MSSEPRTNAHEPEFSLDAISDEFDWVVVTSADLQGRLFGRRVSARDFVKSVATKGVLVSACVYSWDIAQDATMLATGALDYCGFHTGMGDFTLLPDLTTLRRAGWLNRTAICLARSVEPHGEITPVAPRELLIAELARWTSQGLHPSVGLELEFYLYQGTPREARARSYRDLEPTTATPADYSIYEGEAYEEFFADVRHRLAASRIEVEASAIEWGLGQWETTLKHTDPLEMADQSALYKLATKTLAARAGMSATFMAKPYDGGPGSSCHVHLSVRNDSGEPIFWNDAAENNISDELRHAVGGALEHAGEFMSWYAPTVNSYRRIRGVDAAGWGMTWAYEHRFASVRVLGAEADDIRLEFRLPGADANPYLVLTALLASVRDGLTRQTDPGPALIGNPYEKPATGIAQDLGQAVDTLAAGTFAREVVGDSTVEHYLALTRWEWSQFLDSVSEWDRVRYFDLI